MTVLDDGATLYRTAMKVPYGGKKSYNFRYFTQEVKAPLEVHGVSYYMTKCFSQDYVTYELHLNDDNETLVSSFRSDRVSKSEIGISPADNEVAIFDPETAIDYINENWHTFSTRDALLLGAARAHAVDMLDPK